MDEINYLIELLKFIMKNSYLLAFTALFVVGYMLKEHTNFNNKLIPWVLFFLGILMGLSLIQFTLSGAVAGGIMAWVVMGSYEHFKNSAEAYLTSKLGQSIKLKKRRN